MTAECGAACSRKQREAGEAAAGRAGGAVGQQRQDGSWEARQRPNRQDRSTWRLPKAAEVRLGARDAGWACCCSPRTCGELGAGTDAA